MHWMLLLNSNLKRMDSLGTVVCCYTRQKVHFEGEMKQSDPSDFNYMWNILMSVVATAGGSLTPPYICLDTAQREASANWWPRWIQSRIQAQALLHNHLIFVCGQAGFRSRFSCADTQKKASAGKDVG